MWLWTCKKCGNSQGNNNDQEVCQGCGKRIECDESGGHHFRSESKFCEGGCGKINAEYNPPKHPFKKSMMNGVDPHMICECGAGRVHHPQ